MPPHATTEGKPSSQSSVSTLASSSILKANPFGVLADPALMTSTYYTSPQTVIAQALYAISSKVFSYETPGAPDLLDANISLWANHYRRPNAFNVVPVLHRLQLRLGASSTVLGYYSKNGTHGQPLSILAGAQALKYMQPQFANSSAANLPLALNISAIDFDEGLFSNYGTPLAVARNLGYSVILPVTNNGAELQHMTVLNQFLAAYQGRPSVHLFDGPEFVKTFSKVSGLQSVKDLGSLYTSLLTAGENAGTTSADAAIDLGLSSLNSLTGTNYSRFEYSGSANAHTVFVVYGAHESLQLSAVISKLPGVGLISVRVPLPFGVEQFVKTIPSSAKKVIVLTGAAHTDLIGDVTAALFQGGLYHQLSVQEYTYAQDFTWTPITIVKILNEFGDFAVDRVLEAPQSSTHANNEIIATTAPEGKFAFWGADNGVLVANSDRLALSLSLDSSKNVTVRSRFDNSGPAGGVFQLQIVSSPVGAVVTGVDSADVVVIDGNAIAEDYDVLATAKPGAAVVLTVHKAVKSSYEEDVVAKLPLQFRETLLANHNTLSIVDFSTLGDLEGDVGDLGADFLIQLAFWRKAVPSGDNGYLVNKLLQANGNDFELLGAVLEKFVGSAKEKALFDVSVDVKDKEEEKAEEKEEEKNEEKDEEMKEEENEEQEEVQPSFFVKETSFFGNPRVNLEAAEETFHTATQDVAVKLAFPEAYGLKKDLRPDLPVQNFVVKVQENKRLTPAEYSRNIFHIEFDTTGTGLKYEIGEALGIHGRNPLDAVEDFLKFYGVDGDSLVQVTNRDNYDILEVRTARQALTENVDFLGKPPKRFYEALAEHASDDKQAEHLKKLGSGEGAAELKKRQDVDFDTYFDALVEFDSARPSFSELVGSIIAPLKRREYSIASSQKIHPNAVHLLIVVVDWVDPRGRTRYGHCSKYLSDLAIGDELVVSVKPSVMKLPPLLTQPIVMSGLGTGLAPFKAFIEEKIWQQQQGMEIGEVYLYLGSRHKKEEYLYGELWEAYKDAGILTHIGAAFSRDQPEKVYIQDKIRESIEDLTDAVVAKNGSFYLCGPTWPVPDITACLEDIVRNAAKKENKEIKDVSKIVEDMKEEGRYVLEVY